MAAHRALQRKVYDAGYAGIAWPVEYGGQGLPPEYELAFEEEASGLRACPAYALHSGTFGCNVPTMLVHAQPEFLRWFVPQVLRGEISTCKFFSEPSGGSDLAGVRTRAVRDGDTWVLNGQKIWSTLRPPGGLGVLPGPHRLGQAQAPRPDLVRVPDQPARRDHPADPPGR